MLITGEGILEPSCYVAKYELRSRDGDGRPIESGLAGTSDRIRSHVVAFGGVKGHHMIGREQSRGV